MISKADQAYGILRAKIKDGSYRPGHRLVIDQLSREYGISSVPWRESLRRLEAEGWVDIVPHTGAVVKRFHVDAWKQSIRLLARLEGLSTALAAPHLTRSDLEAARALNNQMAISLAELDAERFGCLNRQFHVLLCSRCDDQRLNDLVEHEWMRIDIVRRSVFWHAPGRAAASVAEHDVLLDLIESRADADVIEAAVRAHEVATLQAVLADEEKRGREIA